jgi:hypothetical protein
MNRLSKAAAAIVCIAILAPLIVIYSETQPMSFSQSSEYGAQTAQGILFDKELTVYPASVEVLDPNSQEVGISGGTQVLNFGSVPKGGASEKFISINNTRETKIQAMIIVSGLPMVKALESKVSLSPGQNMTIGIVANATDDIGVGNYTGALGVFVLIPKNAFVSGLL